MNSQNPTDKILLIISWLATLLSSALPDLLLEAFSIPDFSSSFKSGLNFIFAGEISIQMQPR